MGDDNWQHEERVFRVAGITYYDIEKQSGQAIVEFVNDTVPTTAVDVRITVKVEYKTEE